MTCRSAPRWCPCHATAITPSAPRFRRSSIHSCHTQAPHLLLQPDRNHHQLHSTRCRHKADANKPDRSGNTPAHVAGTRGRLPLLVLLLQVGCHGMTSQGTPGAWRSLEAFLMELFALPAHIPPVCSALFALHCLLCTVCSPLFRLQILPPVYSALFALPAHIP